MLLSEIRTVEQLSLLPADSFYVTVNGRIVNWETLQDGARFCVHFRLRGGKGGFGSLLRSFRIHRSTNQLMCRDLSGRRLADVKEEEKLRKWIEKAAEREAEKKRKRREKYEKLKAGPPKHKFDDPDYFKFREKVLEETDDAFDVGIATVSAEKENKKSQPKFDESSSSDDDKDDPSLPGPSKRPVKRKHEFEIFKRKQFKFEDELPSSESGSSEAGVSSNSVEIENVDVVPLNKETSEEKGFVSHISGEGDDDVNAVELQEKREESSVQKSFPDINLDNFEDTKCLQELGLEHLKNALEVRGLKCGGSLEERAARLFAVKGLKPENYPKFLKAVSKNRKVKGSV